MLNWLRKRCWIECFNIKDEVREAQRKINDWELKKMYCSQNTLLLLYSNKKGWMIKARSISFTNPKRTYYRGVDARIIWSWILKQVL